MNNQTQTTLRNMPRLSLISPTAANTISEIPIKKVQPKQERPKKIYPSRVKTLAEAVILQAIEDLWSKSHRQKSIEFFTGDGFRHYADLAGMAPAERASLIKMVGGGQVNSKRV